jgi:hypothetical protein
VLARRVGERAREVASGTDEHTERRRRMTAVFAKPPSDAIQIGMKVGAAWLLIALLSACSTASGPVRPEHVGPASDADAEVRAFRLHALEARLQTMPPGGERDSASSLDASRRGWG